MSNERVFRCEIRNYVIFLPSMKHALVVKSLTERIVLVRMDSGELVTLSVPCRKLEPGILLQFDTDTRGCLIQSVDGKSCKSICRRQDYVIRIEANNESASSVSVSDPDSGVERNVV